LLAADGNSGLNYPFEEEKAANDSRSDSSEKTPILRLVKLVLAVVGKKKVAFKGLKDIIYPLLKGKAYSGKKPGVSFRVKTKTICESPLSKKASSDSEVTFNFQVRKEKKTKRKIYSAEESSPEKEVLTHRKSAKAGASLEKVVSEKRKGRKCSSTAESTPKKVSPSQRKARQVAKVVPRKSVESSRPKSFLRFGHDSLKSKRCQIYHEDSGIIAILQNFSNTGFFFGGGGGGAVVLEDGITVNV
jgi:hypothetical protein